MPILPPTPDPGPRLSRLALAFVLAPISLLGSVACSGDEPREPVARVEPSSQEVRLPHGATATLETVWEAEAPLGLEAPEPWVFVHLLGSEGEILRTFDHPFPGSWTPGETVRHPIDLWQSALAPPLAPGSYDLSLGLVDGPTGTRWPLTVDGRRVDDGEYVVATMVVPDRGGDRGPELEFTGSWGATSPGRDRQVVAVRELETAGSLVLGGLDGPLDLDLSLFVPDPDEGSWRVHRIELPGEENTEGLPVLVRSGCAPEPVVVRGSGVHEVRLELRPAEGGATCEVEIEPGYVLVDPASFERLALQLHRVSWSSPGGVQSGDGDP